MNGDSGFILVKSKRRIKNGRKKNYSLIDSNFYEDDDNSSNNIKNIIRRVKDAQLLIKKSEQLNYFLDALNTSIRLLNKKVIHNFIKAIVCYGLGKFSKCHISMHQLALLLEFKQYYNIPVYIFDPVFSQIEREILKDLDLEVISTNEEGKRKVHLETLFYLPHCPRELVNNILWTNWGLSLSNCIIISNRHSTIITNTPSSVLLNFKYITMITPALQEIEIPNVYRFNDIFNDFALHYFPIEKLETVSDHVWKINEAPVYLDENSEFTGFGDDTA